MRIGVRAHDFGKSAAPVLARRIAEAGLECIQLTPHEAIEGVQCVPGQLSPGFACGISGAFRQRNIQVAVLSCYINMIHPVESERRAGIALFKEHLRFVRDFGCSVVATETGSLNPDFSFHPGNHGEESFQLMLRGLAEMVEEAEKFAAIVAVEGVVNFVASSPRRIRRMLDSISSQNLQVLFDPVNLLNVENHGERDRMLEESFELFGDRIVAVHAKDFRVEGGRMVSVPLGEGLLDLRLLLRNLKARKPLMNVIIEDTSPAVIESSMRLLSDTYKAV
ncbi:MAG: sugar phosphate isomerase/epimerase family protein [Spirochaetia bacterium]|jgi:sugar phosphate isomerase/epimerase